MPTLQPLPTYKGYKSRKGIAAEYGITSKTLLKKLRGKSIQLPNGRVDIRHQKIIYDALSYPPGVSKHDYDGV
jgi:hypothetical protein